MLLASKYEEIYPPEIRDLVFITDRAYNKEQILEMESTMANALQFRLTVPTIYCFLLRYLKVRAAITWLSLPCGIGVAEKYASRGCVACYMLIARAK